MTSKLPLYGDVCADADKSWLDLLHSFGVSGASFIHESDIDPGRRIYDFGDTFLKVTNLAIERSSLFRNQSPAGESRIIALLHGVRAVPKMRAYEENNYGTLLTLEKLPGVSWSVLPPHFIRDLRISICLVWILGQCSLRGIAHHDLRPDNVLVDERGACYLIDFDQGTNETRLKAFLANFLGWSAVESQMKVSFLDTFARRLLPINIQRGLQRLRDLLAYQHMRSLPRLPASASEKHRILLAAWRLGQQAEANAPGLRIAYYSATVDGLKFPGERPWDPRWEVIKSLLDYSGTRILELGCNMGLLSTHLLAEAKAGAALGVDHDGVVLDAAREVSRAYGVSPKFVEFDFDSSDDWESHLAEFKPDIVFALNVYNWIKQKERFLRFLSKFETVIVEGHDAYEVETERLTRFAPGVCKLVYQSERARPLIICRR